MKRVESLDVAADDDGLYLVGTKRRWLVAEDNDAIGRGMDDQLRAHWRSAMQ